VSGVSAGMSTRKRRHVSPHSIMQIHSYKGITLQPVQTAKAGCHLHKPRVQEPNWVCEPRLTLGCFSNTLRDTLLLLLSSLSFSACRKVTATKQGQRLALILSGAKLPLSTAEQWTVYMDMTARAAAEGASEWQWQAACEAPLRVRSSPRAYCLTLLTHTRLECPLLTEALIALASSSDVNAVV